MENNIKEKIKLLKEGKISDSEFLSFIEHFPYKDLGDIKLDFHRKLRRGLPEVIYGSGKNLDQLKKIIEKFEELNENILITRIDEERGKILTGIYPSLNYHEKARIITFRKEIKPELDGKILVITAGASDENVAEEAFVSAEYLGNKVERGYDVGVACINRILDMKSKLNDYSVLIVVAGMEGALPSVVAGLTSTPVIAVPTSIGYGANLNGIAALLSMLNSCAGGLSVVNIDNGFGAAFQATLINRKINGK
ncbi:MAG: nickel pincer cofactor biosynthesis protein LarB [Acidobacteriota bacterium]